MSENHWWTNRWIQISVNLIIFISIILMGICLYQKGICWKTFMTMFGKKPPIVRQYITPKTPLVVKLIPTVTQELVDLKKLESFIKNLQPKIDEGVCNIIAKSIIKHSIDFGFPPELISSLIFRESGFNPLAVSSAKCVGLMQINRVMHEEKLKKLNLKYNEVFKIDNNIHLGCMILYEYYNKDRSIRKALKRYLGGNHTGYVLDILGEYTNSQIQVKKLLKKESVTPKK